MQKYDNGDLYAGNFKQGQRVAGIFETQTMIYEGYFHYNKFEGTGVLTSKANGEKFTGEFAAGMFHGKGVYTWGDGREYKGYVMANNLTGLGVLKYKTG